MRKLSIQPKRNAGSARAHWGMLRRTGVAGLLGVGILAASPRALTAQSEPAPTPTAAPAQEPEKASPSRTPSNAERRRAAKLYMKANRLFDNSQFEPAMHRFEEAAKLDPEQKNYALAASVARSHAVTALTQQAVQARIQGNPAQARVALAHALELDPKNPQATQHLYELADDQLLDQRPNLYERASEGIGEGVTLKPSPGLHEFHLNTNRAQVIQQVFRAYGVSVSIDSSVRTQTMRFDLEDASFEQAMRALQLAANIFYVAIDSHRALVAADTGANRQKFERLELETIYLPGLSATELTDTVNLVKNTFGAQASANASNGSMTVRATRANLAALNATLQSLLGGRDQVMLEVKLFQLAHSRVLDSGVQLPQSMSVFNVYAEAQSILTSNATLVQEIVSAGLASSTDYLTIIAILLASGQVSDTNLSNGFATFGGGALGTTGLSLGTTTVTFNLNTSDSRALEEIQLRLGDSEKGTLRNGTRYPITTSTFSNLTSTASTIAGLTSAGTSSALSALAATLSSVTSIPMVEYQDLGLTLTATPKVLRSGDVALTIEMKIAALTGQELNDIPVLASRSYTGVVTLKEGEATAIVSAISKQESKAISGTPGIAEVPGLSDFNSREGNQSESSLLIVLTPHVVRGSQPAGHTPMMRIEPGANTNMPPTNAPSENTPPAQPQPEPQQSQPKQ